jgi:hypothetical protein
MKISKTMIAWTPMYSGDDNPTRGLIALTPHPGDRRSDEFTSHVGACDFTIDFADKLAAERFLLQAYHWLTCSCGLDPARVHFILTGLDEYAEALVPWARDSLLLAGNVWRGPARPFRGMSYAEARRAEVETQVKEYLARGGDPNGPTIRVLRQGGVSSVFEAVSEDWRS